MIIDEFALANILVKESAPFGFKDARHQNNFHVNIDSDGKLFIRMSRLVHITEKVRDSVYAWLLVDPRTTVDANFLNLSQTFDRGEYRIRIEVTTPLLPSDQQLLKEIGKIITVPSDYTTLVC